MKKSLIALAVGQVLARMSRKRAQTSDNNSFTFRMGAGYVGDISRTHPVSVLPGQPDYATQAPRLFGDAVIITGAGTYRGVTAADTASFACDGIVARPYPTQQTAGGMSAALGAAGVPSISQPLDIVSDGFVMVQVNVGTPTKGGAVYVYTGASTGSHVQGSGFETAAGTNLTLITNAFFNGPADANGVAEVHVHSNTI